MAADQDPARTKLVYLRDRSPRPKARGVRPDRKPTVSPTNELAGEAVWLGRTLMVVAAGTVAYWLLTLSGGVQAHRGATAWRALASSSLAHAFLIGSNGLAATRLLRDGARCSAQVALAAGALVVIALEGLARLVVDGDLSEVSLSVRTEILVNAGVLAIGIWAFSYALRTQKRDRPA